MARWVSRSSAWWLRACARPPARFFHRSTAQRQAHAVPVDAIRNIGIVAHIDAGKTTLTERLLHLTNSLSLPGLQPPSQEHTATAPGDVDSGSTVTDFLEEERERGITIQSAAVGPVWWTNTSNQQAMAMTLVDTPGHVDFGIEVERTVRVVDGAVVVLDGVEGVEPQSENVWRQTKRYGVQAHLYFINKLDRAGASVARSLRSIVDKGLHERPALLQLPVYRSQAPEEAGANVSSKSDDPLIGVVDLLRMQILRFDGVAGEDVVTISLSEERHGTLYATAAEARHALLELVTSLDVDLLDRLLAMDDPDTAMDSVSLEDVQAALRRLTLQGEVCPVLCGAAACNVGVQPLLDAIGLYLPSPKDRPPVDGILHPDSPRAQATTVELTHPGVSALAFKVVWDKRKGPITFVRVYSGTLQSATSLINTTTHQKERISRLLLPYADQYVDVPALHAGQIGVVLGLKDTRTGDTLVDTKRGTHGKGHHKHDMQTLRLRRVHVPPPVFSVSVEPRSKADEAAVSEALRMLVRTDPSLHVTEGGAGASSQTVLSGMGELHLEIAKHRLEGEFQVHAHLGHVRVGYRETVQEGLEASVTELLDQDLGGKKVQAGVTLQVRPLQDDEVGVARLGGNDVVVDLGETPNLTYESGLTLEQVLLQGAQAALARGPLSGYPMQGVHIRLSHIQVFGTDLSSPAAVRLVVATALRKALGYAQRPKPGERVQGHTKLMEPMMRVAVDAPDTYAGKLTSDISVEQHGSIVEMIHPMEQATPSSSSSSSSSSNYQIYIPPDELDQGSERTDVSQPLTIIALIPLARMMRYSTRLRALTGGTGTYRMTLHGFEAVSPDRERALLQELGRIPR